MSATVKVQCPFSLVEDGFEIVEETERDQKILVGTSVADTFMKGSSIRAEDWKGMNREIDRFRFMYHIIALVWAENKGSYPSRQLTELYLKDISLFDADPRDVESLKTKLDIYHQKEMSGIAVPSWEGGVCQ